MLEMEDIEELCDRLQSEKAKIREVREFLFNECELSLTGGSYYRKLLGISQAT